MISISIALKEEHEDGQLNVATGRTCSVCGKASDIALVFGHYNREPDDPWTGGYDEVVVCDQCTARLLEPMSDIEFEMLLEADL